MLYSILPISFKGAALLTCGLSNYDPQ